MRFEIFLLLTLLLSSNIEAHSKGVKKFYKQCNIDLIKQFGMKGNKFPSRKKLVMCPKVHFSCCRESDQLAMYMSIEGSKTKKHIENKFKMLTTVYSKTLSLMNQTHTLAKKIVKKLEGKQISNCKFLAKKIMMFEIDQTKKCIIDSFKKMEKYMVRAYLGVYCSVCNHENHLFYNTKDNEIYYSLNFCRKTIEHDLIPLLYMNVHFKHMKNTITEFVSKCDFKGQYQLEVKVNEKHLFPVDELVEKELLECRNHRNKPDWFVECELVCKNFKLDKFSPLIVPDVRPVQEYNKYLESQLKRINNEARLKVIAAAGGTSKKAKAAKKKLEKEAMKGQKKVIKKERLLAAAAAAGGGAKKKGAKGKQKVTNVVYNAAKVKFDDKTNIEFSKEGIDLDSDGKNTSCTKATADVIKAKINAKKTNKKVQRPSPKRKGSSGLGFSLKKSGLFGNGVSSISMIYILGMLLILMQNKWFD